MKQIKWKQSKAALLALACGALLTPVAHAATVTAGFGDLILGFRGTNSAGAVVNLEVNLGSVSNFYNTGASEIHLPNLAVADLVATYGANWNRADVYWGAVATVSSSGTLGFPGNTLFATAPNCASAPLNANSSGQGAGRVAITGLYTGKAGSLNNATSTLGTTYSTVVPGATLGSWSDASGGNGGFNFFPNSVENFEGADPVVSQLYQLKPAPGVGSETPGIYLGDLILRATGPNAGINFRGPLPTQATCKPITRTAGLSCTVTITGDDIDNGSTGYCLQVPFTISAPGPLPVGTTNVTLTVTDGFGVSSSCSSLVTVLGAGPSVASHPNTNSCNALVAFTSPTATAGCSPLVGGVTCTPPSPHTFPVGVSTVICTATDTTGKIGTNSFTVTISGAAPSVTCPANISTSVVGNATSVVVNYATPAGNGCATPINVVCVPASGTAFNVGNTQVNCTATDALNQVGNCNFTIQVSGAGASGCITLVNALTDPKLTLGRKNSLIGALNRAQADVNHVPARIKQACGQLKGFIKRAQVYARLGIITQPEADSLIACAQAQLTANNCTP